MLTYMRTHRTTLILPEALDTALRQEAARRGITVSVLTREAIARWWIRIMLDTEHPFQEAVALLWHDHFAVSSEGLPGGQTHFMVDHVNLLRRLGLGNFRDFLV